MGFTEQAREHSVVVLPHILGLLVPAIAAWQSHALYSSRCCCFWGLLWSKRVRTQQLCKQLVWSAVLINVCWGIFLQLVSLRASAQAFAEGKVSES